MPLLAALTFLTCLRSVSLEMERPQFKKQKVRLKGQELLVEIADNEQKRSFGLMMIRELRRGEGMLFIFPDSAPRSFWMKNTFVPLSIAFFNEHGVLLNVHDMKEMKSTAEAPQETYASQGPAQFALEVPRGWFQSNGVKVGDRLTCLRLQNNNERKEVPCLSLRD